MLFFAVATFSASGQGLNTRSWQWQNPLPQGNTINNVKFAADKKTGWAVGGDGTILRTRNGGFTWEEQDSFANTTLYSLYVKDKARLVVSGAGGVILTSNNGGAKWIRRATGTRDHLFCVTFAPQDHLKGWAVGSFGAIVQTIDGGVTWKLQPAITNAHLFSVAFGDATHGWLSAREARFSSPATAAQVGMSKPELPREP